LWSGVAFISLRATRGKTKLRAQRLPQQLRRLRRGQIAKIKIDPGTQSGRIVRLRGKGLPAVDSYGNGDLLVNINVWTPQKLSSDERAILEKLCDSANFQPAADHQERGFFDKVRDMFA
jgi:DnaJ-class molecular chaperone